MPRNNPTLTPSFKFATQEDAKEQKYTLYFQLKSRIRHKSTCHYDVSVLFRPVYPIYLCHWNSLYQDISTTRATPRGYKLPILTTMMLTAPPSKAIHLSSPGKPLLRSLAGNGHDETPQASYGDWVRNVSEDDMWMLLQYSKDVFIKEYKDAPTKGLVEKEEHLVPAQDPSVYCKLLNRLSSHVRDRAEPAVTDIVRFVDGILPEAFVGHPAVTKSCPALVAVVIPADQKATTHPHWHWSELEMTGGIRSHGKYEPTGYFQAATCTGYLLQARPDRTAVLGIFVDQNGFRLIFTNVFGASCTSPVEWDLPHSVALLCAWISRLYAPCLDESIKRVNCPDGPTFTITTKSGNKEKSYAGCSIYRVGGSFHRRTTVLTDCKQKTVIKEQYIDVGRRFEEGSILDIVHAQKTFPGVVRKESYSVVQLGGKELVIEDGELKRKKIRLIMPDIGRPLMDAETPFEALVGFYDLLEVTRFLYTKRGVLHKDVSSGNVLLRSEFPSSEDFGGDLGDMCFASFLLKEKAPHSNVTRLDTRILLIDFDMSENHNEVVNTIGEPMQRTGTPIFMARIVRSGRYPDGLCDLPAMPRLDEGKARYEQCVGARLKAFPDNNRKILDPKNDQALPFFLHKLRYDAESVFWLLLYWRVLAKPERDPVPQRVPSSVWTNLTSVDEKRDDRESIFITNFPKILCHSTYAPLERLLKDMAAHLRGDLDFADEALELAEDLYKGVGADSSGNSSRIKDEYLNEAFQRLIFNFLFKHYDAEFMKEKKSKSYRELERDQPAVFPRSDHQRQTRSSSQLNRKRKAEDISGELGDVFDYRWRDKRTCQN